MSRITEDELREMESHYRPPDLEATAPGPFEHEWFRGPEAPRR